MLACFLRAKPQNAAICKDAERAFDISGFIAGWAVQAFFVYVFKEQTSRQFSLKEKAPSINSRPELVMSQ